MNTKILGSGEHDLEHEDHHLATWHEHKEHEHKELIYEDLGLEELEYKEHLHI